MKRMLLVLIIAALALSILVGSAGARCVMKESFPVFANIGLMKMATRLMASNNYNDFRQFLADMLASGSMDLAPQGAEVRIINISVYNPPGVAEVQFRGRNWFTLFRLLQCD